MIKRILKIIAISLFILNSLSSQPEWVENCPEGKFNEFYFCGFSVDKDFNLALSKAFDNAVLKIKRTYSVDVEVKIDKTPNLDNSRLYINMRGLEQQINLRIAETYYEKIDGLYHVWVLVALPKPPSLAKSPPSDLGAIIRSAVIPGWGQLYKGRTERAVLFFTAETISGAISYYLLTSPAKKAKIYGKFSLWVTLGIHILNIIDSGNIQVNIYQ